VDTACVRWRAHPSTGASTTAASRAGWRRAHPRSPHTRRRSTWPSARSCPRSTAGSRSCSTPDNIDRAVAALLASQERRTDRSSDRDAVKRRLADAETRLSRLRAAIEAGADPAALVESLNAAQEQRAAAQAELAIAKPDPWELSEAEIYAMIDSLGDVGAASLTRAAPARMQKIYKSLRLEMIYDNDQRAVDVVIKPLGGLVGVSEGGLEPPPPYRGLAPQASASAIPPLGPAARPRGRLVGRIADARRAPRRGCRW
jgi:hypothetical protein